MSVKVANQWKLYQLKIHTLFRWSTDAPLSSSSLAHATDPPAAAWHSTEFPVCKQRCKMLCSYSRNVQRYGNAQKNILADNLVSGMRTGTVLQQQLQHCLAILRNAHVRETKGGTPCIMFACTLVATPCTLFAESTTDISRSTSLRTNCGWPLKLQQLV